MPIYAYLSGPGVAAANIMLACLPFFLSGEGIPLCPKVVRVC